MILRALCGAICLLALVGCGGKGAAPHGSPAKVEKAPTELDIARVTLEPKAKERLGIVTVPVKLESVERRRTLPGELMTPIGKTTVVSAQISGTVQAPQPQGIPLPGSTLSAGDPVLRIAPLLTPERFVPTPAERVQMANAQATLAAALTVAQGDVERGKADVAGFKIALERAERLFADKAGPERAVDDAKQQLAVATATYEAAQHRASELERLMQGLAGSEQNPTSDVDALTIRAPQTGVLRSLSVSQGQAVSAGAPLFDVVDVRTMWVRVPVYIGMLEELRTDVDARLVGLDGDEAEFTRPGKPVEAPPSADPVNTTADIFFEVDNADATLKPGERVGVELAVKGAEESLVVPSAAILYDIYGGTWVYEAVDEFAFERRRVAVRFVDDDVAVLAEGPDAGTPIVVDGAAELFGTEFGAGK